MTFKSLLLYFAFVFANQIKAQVMWQLKTDSTTKLFLKNTNEFEKFDSNLSNNPVTNLPIFPFKYGLFELRFKIDWKNINSAKMELKSEDNSEIVKLFEGNDKKKNQFEIEIKEKKFVKIKIRTKENYELKSNIILVECTENDISYYYNGNKIFNSRTNTNSNKYFQYSINEKNSGVITNNKNDFVNPFIFDYIRIWSKEDTIDRLRDNYKLFELSPNTIYKNNGLVESDAKLKRNYSCCKEKDIEKGFITLLPILYNKYSLSILGKNLGKIQVDVIDNQNAKVAGFELENINYYVLDLSALPTGPYVVKINVLNQILTHQIPIINPDKVGEH